jgi:hypothetical protein
MGALRVGKAALTMDADAATANEIRTRYQIGDGRLPEVAVKLKAHSWDFLKTYGYGVDMEDGVYGSYKISDNSLRAILKALLDSPTQAELAMSDRCVQGAISGGKLEKLLGDLEQFQAPPAQEYAAGPARPIERRPSIRDIDDLVEELKRLLRDQSFADVDQLCSEKLMCPAVDEDVRACLVQQGAEHILMEYIGLERADIPKTTALRTLRNMFDSRWAHDKLTADPDRFQKFVVGLENLLCEVGENKFVALQTMEKLCLNQKSLFACYEAGLFTDMVFGQLEEMMESSNARTKKAAESIMAAITSTANSAN